MSPRRAVILCRISDARNEDTTGVERQEVDGRALAKRMGWGVSKVVTENDTSAYHRRQVRLPDGSTALRVVRPEYRAVLADLATGRADGLIAYDLDRTTRDPRDLEDLIDVVESGKPRIPVESVTGSLRLASDADVTMARVMTAIGNKSSRDTGRRVARAAEDRARAGKFSGGRRPFGFEADGVTLRESEAAEVRQAADKLLTGMSVRQVLRDMAERGITTVIGGEWNTRVLRTMLLSPRVAGHSVYRGEIVKRDAWPAILDEETWQAVVRLLNDPKRRTTPGNTPKHLLSLIARCGHCDGYMTVTSSDRGRQVYRCVGNYCTTRRKEHVEAVVEGVVVGLLSRPDALELLDRQAGPDVDLGALRAEAATLRERMDALAVDFAEGILTRSQMRAGSERIEARLTDIDALTASVGERSPLAGVAGPNAAQVWEGLDIGRKRAIVRALVEVKVFRQPQAGRPSRAYFDPQYVEITPIA